MLNHHDPHAKPNTSLVFLLLLFLVFTVYSNTLKSSWHFDDIPNVLQNYSLHLVKLNPDSISRTFFAHPSSGSKVYRPLVNMSFGLNWYFGKDNVTGYHVFNILIHFFTAFILYLTIVCLFQSPKIKVKYPDDSIYFIALLSSVLWAINPIQTQAVVYIVQRMALMAALFFILSICFYIRARLSSYPLNRIVLLLGSFFCFVLALGSKENTATLPLVLLLVEAVFFQDLKEPETRKKFLRVAAIVGLSLMVVAGIILFRGGLSYIYKGYAIRPFTLAERLMTEPRILIFYLSQIFFPLPSRLSFVHDIVLSTSLLKPWTTIPAVLIVFLLIGFGFSQINKRPLLAFGILFFFLNHLIESTIVPLELIFEHRNYLPSLFLFVPVAWSVKWLIDYFNRRNRYIYLGIVFLLPLLLIALGHGAYIRNKVWAGENSLWLDAMKKAPGSARPHQILAAELKKVGRLDDSLKLYQRALFLQDPKPKQSQSLSFNNMGNIYAKKQEYEKALKHYKKALELDPGNEKAWYNLAIALIDLQQWEAASHTADILISKWSFHPKYQNLKGFILVKQKRPEAAISCFKRALKLARNDRGSLVNMGMALSLSGKHERAAWFLKRANSIYPDDILIILCLAENSLRAGNSNQANTYVNHLLDEFGEKKTEEFLKRQSKDNHSVTLSYSLLIPVIVDSVETRAGGFAKRVKILTDSN